MLHVIMCHAGVKMVNAQVKDFFIIFFFNTNAQETNAIKCILSAIDSVMPLLLCLLEENVSELRREACTRVVLPVWMLITHPASCPCVSQRCASLSIMQ